jgi:hypothetical protein
MKFLKTSMLLFILLGFINLKAQTFEVPKKYEFKSADDYSRYEKDIIEAAKWLKATPFDQEVDKRKEVSAFVVQWINGSPTVNVEITPSIIDFENRNTGMLLLYMASSAKYVLENNYSKNMRAKHKAALEDMIWAYKSGFGIKKDRNMERLISFYDENRLEEWIEKNMRVNIQ